MRLGSGRACQAAVALACLLAPAAGEPQKPGSPEANLPPSSRQLTGFGERASWSPDGRRLAFMGKSFGDAFEYDRQSGLTRLLTGHFLHAGFLRVQYLPNGDFLLIGARSFTDIRTTRAREQEMWVMKANARTPPVPLDHRISEGVAISRTHMRIAWANTRGQYPEQLGEGESVIHTADIVERDGVPILAGKKEVLRARTPQCTLEAQDFRNDDRELIYTCYRQPHYADVLGVDLVSGRVTTYRNVADEYNEAEGIFPDGRHVVVESSREQGPERQDASHIDLWKLGLEPGGAHFSRLTRWGDYEGYKASNPVVSPDGRWMAFQSARTDEPAGVGHGIFLLRLP